MTNIKHLTNNQLIAYHNGSLEKYESHTIGKHLLMCAECRKQLPIPSVEKFWSAILTENESEADMKTKKSNPFSSLFEAFSSFWSLHFGLVLSGAALLVLLSFSFLIWLNIVAEPNEVAQSFEVSNDLSSKHNFPLPDQSPTGNNRDSLKNANQVVSSTSKQPKIESPKPKLSSEKNINPNFDRKNLKEKQDKISSTRGISAKCGENPKIEFELSGNKENFVFKWKKIPKAVKYHLYISDDEEILIDEYETEAETTFILKKQLDPLKTYRWKIIITMKNGRIVAGPAKKFTVKDFQINQTKPEKKKDINIRCSADG